MRIEVPDNPNCAASEEYVFQEIERPRPIRGILVEERGGPAECDVAAVDAYGKFSCAHAVKITDSGAGFAYLIYGGEWGIRLKAAGRGDWSLEDPSQWGEPFKIYGAEDILFL